MNELCRLVQQFESTWQPMPGGDGEVRRFHDWRSGLQLFDTDYRQRFDGVDGPGWSALTASFLYDHRVVLPTAIPPYEFSRSCGRERFLESRRSAFRGLAHMAPLVDSGDLLLIPSIDWAMDQEGHHPQWVVDAYSRAHEEAAESMRDSRWHQLAKEIHATPSVAEGAEIGFQVAHSVHAEYAAAPTFWSSTGSPHPYEEYLRYRRERVRTRMARASIDLQVYEAVRRVSLPGLRGLDAEALVSVRRQHDGFDEWRRALRSAVRLIESSPAQPEFVAEATEILNDIPLTITPAIAAAYLENVAETLQNVIVPALDGSARARANDCLRIVSRIVSNSQPSVQTRDILAGGAQGDEAIDAVLRDGLAIEQANREGEDHLARFSGPPLDAVGYVRPCAAGKLSARAAAGR